MNAPDLSEPLVGYRAWRLADDGSLEPWSAGGWGRGTNAWIPGINRARCLVHVRARHRAPGHDCTCGLYALADLNDPRLHFDKGVVGAVVAWGDVELHRTGFRAEFAQIVALACPRFPSPQHRARLDRAAARYGVPVVAPDLLAALALEYGRPVRFDQVVAHRASRRKAPALGDDGAEGIALDSHLGVRLRDGMLALSLTEALARAVAPGSSVIVPEPGVPVQRGDPLARIGGDGGFVLEAPAAGVVGRFNEALLDEPELMRTDPRGHGWICELAPTDWPSDGPEIAWGRAGRIVYAALLERDRGHDDPFWRVRPSWVSAHAGVRSAADVLAALQAERDRPRFADEEAVYAAVGGALSAAVADPAASPLLTREPLVIAWRLHHPDADLLLDLRGPVPSVVCGPARVDDADLVLYAPAALADDYFSGRGDISASLRAGKLQSSGSLLDVLSMAGLTKALHRPYRAHRRRAAPAPSVPQSSP